MTKKRRLAASLLLAAALGLALLGQFYFFRRPEYGWDGVVLYAGAVLCFALSWRTATAHTRQARVLRESSPDLVRWVREIPIPVLLLVIGACCSALATLLSHNRLWNQSTGDVVALWLLGLGLVMLAALWPASWTVFFHQDWQSRLRAVSREMWLEVATIAGLTCLSLLLRSVSLGSLPFTLGGDEAWHGLLARQVLAGELRNPFVMGYMSMPTFFYWPLSWSLWLWGNSMAALRLPAVLAGTVTVPLLYLFARRLWGRRIAFLAALLLTTYDYHIHYSRLGANNVWDALFVMLTLWVVEVGLTADEVRKQARGFLLSGVVMGISVYFYTGARLLPVLVGIYLLFPSTRRWLRPGKHDSLKGLNWRSVGLMLMALLIVAGPILSYALTHPNEWNARINQVGIIQSGWLPRESDLTGKSTLLILGEQFFRSAGAFHFYPDRTVWYGADRPLLGFLAGIFAVLGMVWTTIRWKERRYFLLLIWYWSVIITGGMLTESPPSSQRLVIAIPAVALLVAIGLEHTVRLVRRLVAFHRSWENSVLALLVLVLAFSSVRFYFVEYTPERRYGGANGETATMMGHYLHELDGTYDAYFFGAPLMYWSFGSMTFLAPDVRGKDVVEHLDAPPEFMLEGDNTVFLFLPERATELSWVQMSFPGGRTREFNDAAGRTRFVAYEIP